MSEETVIPRILKEKNGWFQSIRKNFTYHNISYQIHFIKEKHASLILYRNKALPFLLTIIIQQSALADRLAQAAISANSHLLTIAQATSGIAFALGAIFYHFGAPHMGKQILIGGVIGLAATFGGPAMIELLRSVFNA